MTKKEVDKSFGSDFRRFFLRGLATLLPTILTFFLLMEAYKFIQENISVHITKSVSVLAVEYFEDYPEITKEDRKLFEDKNPGVDFSDSDEGNANSVNKQLRLWKMLELWNNGPRSLVGFGLSIILVYIVGRLLGSFIGRRLWKLFEKSVVGKLPGFKQLYPHVKQVTDFFIGDNKKITFNRVVAVQYPSKGIWSIGLVTGDGMKSITEYGKSEYLTIFIPSSPTPITGYVIHVSKDEVVDLPLTIEEALRFTISGGVIVPDHQELARNEQGKMVISLPKNNNSENGKEQP